MKAHKQTLPESTRSKASNQLKSKNVQSQVKTSGDSAHSTEGSSRVSVEL